VSDLRSDPRAVAGLRARIEEAAARVDRQITLMEVCGTHTHAVAAAGLRRMLPDSVRLISGPGCPVCVTPVDYLDRALALARLPDTTVCTFGDLMRVPSSTSSLEQARADGADIQIVYSPRDALQMAAERPAQRVVFLAVGFETTVPTIAAALAEAEAQAVANFVILPGNKLIPPPMRALVEDPELKVDGFLLPGHVSVITGWHAFRFLAEDYRVSGAVVGFEATDILQGVLELAEALAAGVPAVSNRYGRAVSAEGNRAAAAVVGRFFEPAADHWRGFGEIPASGLALKAEWRQRDATPLARDLPEPREPQGCRCGDVLRGLIEPPQCPLFASTCTPLQPEGACMVSSEGTCAAWYRHERFSTGGGP
jgi:hydrogenase expression/formation protein HypD